MLFLPSRDEQDKQLDKELCLPRPRVIHLYLLVRQDLTVTVRRWRRGASSRPVAPLVIGPVSVTLGALPIALRRPPSRSVAVLERRRPLLAVVLRVAGRRDAERVSGCRRQAAVHRRGLRPGRLVAVSAALLGRLALLRPGYRALGDRLRFGRRLGVRLARTFALRLKRRAIGMSDTSRSTRPKSPKWLSARCDSGAPRFSHSKRAAPLASRRLHAHPRSSSPIARHLDSPSRRRSCARAARSCRGARCTRSPPRSSTSSRSRSILRRASGRS